jgi:hypothetical protein
MKKVVFYFAAAIITLSLISSVFAQCFWFDQQPQYYYPYHPYFFPIDKPVIISGRPVLSGVSVITNKCYTDVTIPITSSVRAGQRVFLEGRIFNSVIGYPIVNPKVWIYFDGNLVGSAQGDFNGNYYFSFPVSEFMRPGMHSISANATMDNCEPGVSHASIFIDEPMPSPAVFPPAVTNLGSLIIKTTDCSSGEALQSYIVLSPGVYGQIARSGEALFSNIPPTTYNYYVSAPGYDYKSGTAVVETDETATENVCLTMIEPPRVVEPPKHIEVPQPYDPPAEPMFQIYSFGLPLAVLAVLMIVGAVYNNQLSRRYRTPEEL